MHISEVTHTLNQVSVILAMPIDMYTGADRWSKEVHTARKRPAAYSARARGPAGGTHARADAPPHRTRTATPAALRSEKGVFRVFNTPDIA